MTTKWTYGMGDAGDRVLGLMEAAMWQLQRGMGGAVLAFCKELPEADRKEFMEIYEDGVKKFEKSSEGVSPLQRVMVGVTYTLRALKEWREKGAMHGAEEGGEEGEES